MKETNTAQQAVPTNGAWWVFAAFGLLFIIYGIYAFTLPYYQIEQLLRAWGLPPKSNTAATLAADFRGLGLLSVLLGILTVGIAYGGFRRGQGWAWYTFLSFPAFFLLAIPFTEAGLMWSPFLIASIVGLWVPYHFFFRRP
ncbi:MAG: hypothetical protein H0W30_03765 [Gemmatimonadaceae bacterium]|nr:hypothetical protein [Gemmatimonadaceae bacterium]